MRRLAGSVVGALLLGLAVSPMAAQRAAERPPVVLEEPRPNPVLPAALVPFSIDAEVCRKNHVPLVSLKVHNSLSEPVAALVLRGKQAEVLEDHALRCGNYVAVWNGTIDGGTRVAPPSVYWIQLTVDDRVPRTRKLIVANP